ncbi:Hypothetical protein HDN1F_17200 [gamma proteobacterium HdN1]|nr:Hypothetical protein HDN1F_17200 [gamma proteobacterium HdN1]
MCSLPACLRIPSKRTRMGNVRLMFLGLPPLLLAIAQATSISRITKPTTSTTGRILWWVCRFRGGLTQKPRQPGIDDWKTVADWAYVRYQPRSDFYWQVGRMRVPFFLYSESINVGYSYPWISPPFAVYQIPFWSVDGISLNRSLSFHSVDFEFQLYGGGARTESVAGATAGVVMENDKQFGVIAQATWQNWTSRIALHQASIGFDLGGLRSTGSDAGEQLNRLIASLEAAGYHQTARQLETEDDKSHLANLALQYDDGRFLMTAEGSFFTTHNETPVSDIKNYYLMAGYRDGNFQYFLTHSHFNTSPPKISGELPPDSPFYAAVSAVTRVFRPQPTRAWAAGVRWDFAEKMAYKFEAIYFPDLRAVHPIEVRDDDVLLVRMGVQTIF